MEPIDSLTPEERSIPNPELNVDEYTEKEKLKNGRPCLGININ